MLSLFCTTEKVLERGERIELLVDKTETLSQNAFQFKKSSTALKRAMWWKNVKLMVLIIFLILVGDDFHSYIWF
jgi:vesicle-associated membrane protein 7